MKMILLALLLAITLPAKADEPFETCTRYAEFARVVMKARQANAPIEKVWPAATDAIMRQIVTSAYKKPIWATDAYKNDAIQNFGSDIFLVCMENMK